ncbi:MAG: hypothetical protein KIG65_08665 [Eubacteriales bacterium]|nr:hypothetical protein [Eubacteriales bacterium]
MADWTDRISSVVFTRIKNEFSNSLKTKYKMTSSNFSTVGSSDTPAVFPFVYIQLLPSAEQGQDIEGNTINAGLFTFQIEVTDNQTQARAKDVMSEVKRIMKSMRFTVQCTPTLEDTKDTHRAIIRCNQIIGSCDIL